MSTRLPGSVLAVMAHPDDAELWAGGTLVLHAEISAVTVLVAARDERRRREAIKAALILGVDVEIVDCHSAERCDAAIRKLLPDVIVTHRLDDCHVAHRDVAEQVFRVIPKIAIETGRPLRLYTCDSYESMTLNGPVTGRVIVDVTRTYHIKKRALAVYESQPFEHFSAMADRLAASWGARIRVQWAEAFDVVPVLGRVPGRDYL